MGMGMWLGPGAVPYLRSSDAAAGRRPVPRRAESKRRAKEPAIRLQGVISHYFGWMTGNPADRSLSRPHCSRRVTGVVTTTAQLLRLDEFGSSARLRSAAPLT